MADFDSLDALKAQVVAQGHNAITLVPEWGAAYIKDFDIAPTDEDMIDGDMT